VADAEQPVLRARKLFAALGAKEQVYGHVKLCKPRAGG
jgi:hypothetical protein